MFSIYNLKPKFQILLKPALDFLFKNKVTPNAVTLTALVASIAVGILSILAQNHIIWLLLLPIWLFLRMALNAIDGMMARGYNLMSPLGAVLNEVGDVLSDMALYIPLAIIDPKSTWAVIAFCFGALLTEFCGVLGPLLKVSRHYEGPMGKSDRAFLIGLLAMVTVVFPSIKNYWQLIFIFAAILTVWTCKNRLENILKEKQ